MVNLKQVLAGLWWFLTNIFPLILNTVGVGFWAWIFFGQVLPVWESERTKNGHGIPLIIAVEADWPPWSDVLKDGTLQGFHKDLGHLVCKFGGQVCDVVVADAIEIFNFEQNLAEDMLRKSYGLALGWSNSKWRSNSARFTKTAWTPKLHSVFWVRDEPRADDWAFLKPGYDGTIPADVKIGYQSAWVATENCLLAAGMISDSTDLQPKAIKVVDCGELMQVLANGTADVIFALLSDGTTLAPNGCMNATKINATTWQVTKNGWTGRIKNDNFRMVNNCVESGYTGAAHPNADSNKLEKWEDGMDKLREVHGNHPHFTHLCKCWDKYQQTQDNNWDDGKLGEVCMDFSKEDKQPITANKLKDVKLQDTKDWCKHIKEAEGLDLDCCNSLLAASR
eukprot:TRINITY_DN61325_c0_g1_i3.p1 TRINITY_DN61325_c0_g1~~TRINITY_DN61325_c0_g1_i3.p1  ORF type:complete len:394 (-),score=51.90 TRINITY_DN61325_c0_g1_i3:33-1214(-)